MNDLISRQAAIDELDFYAELLRRLLDGTHIVGVEREKYEWGLELIESCISDMEELSSAQPEDCTDCREYDHERHNCPKWCKVIRNTVEELKAEQRWIPCSERLPEDEEEVIVSVRDDSGDNTLDYSSCGWYACAGDFWVVDNDPCYKVVAWMPLPEPYKDCEHE